MSLLQRPSLPSGPSSIFDAAPFVRKSIPGSHPTAQPATVPTSHIHDRILDALLHPASAADTVHQYNLKSRGRDYAIIAVKSHARTALDTTLLYFGEEIKGFVILSLNDLSDMQNMDVAVSWFVFQ